MIPSATVLQEELALRRAIESAADSAPSPDAAERQALVLMDRIEYEIRQAIQERRVIRTSVEVPFNFREKHNASLNQLRLFLLAKGYSVTVNTDTVTISWA
jgi:hypothetical protein